MVIGIFESIESYLTSLESHRNFWYIKQVNRTQVISIIVKELVFNIEIPDGYYEVDKATIDPLLQPRCYCGKVLPQSHAF